jgi:hypothetical protein
MPRQTSNRLSPPEINTLGWQSRGVGLPWKFRATLYTLPPGGRHCGNAKRTSLSVWRITMSSKKLRIARSAQAKALDQAVTDTWKDQDAYLDEALRETMPASDPISPGRVHRVARKDPDHG